jgi:NAD(P)-dependent dehydrogenase (short-subunit alcohol dehydrogenase family)
MSMVGRFDGRTALVTGAAGGIGTAVARRLAGEGAHVALADLSFAAVERLSADLRAVGMRASAHRLDVTNGDDITRVLDEVETQARRPTLAVTCAGIIFISPFLEATHEHWDQTLAVNLTGTFLVIQAVARRLVAAGEKGRLVAISSVSGRGGRADSADYAASKAGVISVVRSAALALAPYHITVNAVCPGVVDTEMTRRIHAVRAGAAGIAPEESLQRMAARIPLGRVQTAKDVADVVSFLLSDDAGYVTGQSLNADGGMEMD